MSIVVKPADRADEWMAALTERLAGENLRMWPQVGDPQEVEFVLAWHMEMKELARFTKLQAVFSLGAGVDQWTALAGDERFGAVDVVRLVDPAMSDEMAAYALHWVLHFQRGFDQLAALQDQHRFEAPSSAQAAHYPIGILGYGNIGRRIGQVFLDLGYGINAWTRTVHPDRRVESDVTLYAGLDQLDAFLTGSRAVINVLPDTPSTSGLLDPVRLAAFAEGAVLVNMGRGTLVREADLLAALDGGPMRVAVLDVTDPEPPDPSSPRFDHPKVVLTGHSAGSTLIPSASTIIAANIGRIRRGEHAFPLLDRKRGY